MPIFTNNIDLIVQHLEMPILLEDINSYIKIEKEKRKHEPNSTNSRNIINNRDVEKKKQFYHFQKEITLTYPIMFPIFIFCCISRKSVSNVTLLIQPFNNWINILTNKP